MKKNYLLLFLFALLLTNSYGQDLGCVSVVARTPLPICNVGDCRTITAAPPLNSVPRQTTSYTVSSTPFVWRSPENVNDATGIVADDDWSGIVPLRGKQTTPFSFCFFGEKYNECLITDNGAITFSIAGHPDSPGGRYVPGSPNSGYVMNGQTLPFNPGPGNNATLPYTNSISGVLQDLWINRYGSPPPPPSVINFFAIGTYPCRAFVANWDQIPLYSGSCSAELQSYQIVLFESTNIIEVHVKNRTSCPTWNGGFGLIGIQNEAGTTAFTPPNRNTGTWNVPATASEAWRFTPSGPPVPITYQWTDTSTGNIVGTGPSISVCPIVSTTYCVTATFGSCDPTIPPIMASDCATVKVNEPVGFPPKDIKHCTTDTNPNLFNIGINTDIVLGTIEPGPPDNLNPSDFEINYYESVADAENDASPINTAFYDPANTAAPVWYTLPAPETDKILYVKIVDIISDCSYIVPFTVYIRDCDPQEIDPLIICDISNDSQETFDLNDELPVIQAAIAAETGTPLPADYSITFHETLADADDVTTALTAAEIAAYPGVPGDIIYVRAEEISDPTNAYIYFFDLDLVPTPVATIAGGTEICENSTATITFSGTPGATVEYTDETGATQTILLVDNGTGTGVATITTPAVVAVNSPYTYTLVSVTLTTNGVTCTQPLTDSAIVRVGGLPTAQINTTNTTICEDTTTIIEVEGTRGAVVTYTDQTGTHTLPLDATTGIGNITVPATLAPNATYTYTLVSVSTTGAPPCTEDVSDTVDIEVAPLPTVTITPIDTQVCLGSPSRVRFSGLALAHVDYTLEGAAAQIQLDATGEFILTEVLPAAGTYDYELVGVTSDEAPFCTQLQSGTVSIEVVAGPTATLSTTTPVICENGSVTIDFSGTPNTDLVYTINTGAEQTIRLNPSAADPTIGVASITRTLTADATFTLVRVTTLGTVPCSTNLTDSLLIEVNPLPTATISARTTPVCEGTGTIIDFTGPINGIVTFAIGTNPSQNLTLDATGNGSYITGNLTVATTYRLLGVATTDPVPCSRVLNLSVTVGVKALPTATFTGPANVCSNRTAELEFTGTPNATVTFTPDGGTTILSVTLDGAGYYLYTTDPITALTSFDLITVTTSGLPACPANLTESVVITPIAAPIIFNPTPLEVCDDNTDGVAVFDLKDKDEEITGGPSTLIVTYHETEQNAIDNVFPKQDFPYSNLIDASPEAAPYIMWVRVEEPGGSQCPSFTQLRLIVNRTPQPVSPAAIEICDDATADGLAQFPDIGIREPDMILNLNPLDTYTFEYYLNEIDAKADVPANPAIPSINFNNTVPYSQIIWVRVSNSVTGCFKAVSLELIVNPNPVIPAPGVLPEYSLCDDPSGDGYEVFNLEEYKSEITTVPGLDIKYYFDDAALAAGDELDNLQYQNEVQTVQTIIVGVTNTATGCFSRTTLTLRVQPLPLINIPAQIPTICDPDGNATEQFDLDALIPEITGGADYIISFHETSENAEDNVFPYTSPYDNLASGIIWIRATDRITGCYSIAPLQLIVNPVPVVPTNIDDLVICDTNADGSTRVDLVAHATQDLLDAQTPGGNYTVVYYLTEPAAENGTGGSITNPTNYLATNGQTIWVRVTNTDTGCYNIGSFDVVINPSLSFAPVEYSICDNALPNDGFNVFDLTTQIADLTNNLPGYSVAFYTLAGTLIDPANAYTNQNAGAQTLNVVITNIATTCVSRTTLTIRVEPLPNPRTDPEDIEACDNGTAGDGIAEGVDLTVNEVYIRNNANPAAIEFYYYTDQAVAIADGNQGTTFPNAIPDPTDYDGPAGTIYVLMTTNANNPTAIKCYQLVQFDLIVNPLPALGDNGVIDDYVACVGGSTNTFTLSNHNIEVIADGLNVADYTFTYYHTEPEAQGGVPGTELPNSYPNATNPEQIWVRVENITTGCFSVGTFNLIVDEPAVANPVTDPALITKCDMDGTNDGLTDFDLTAFDAIVLGTQTLPDFTVHYYDDLDEAEADGDEGITTTNPNALTNLNPYNTGTATIYALVINRTSRTGCPAIVPIQLTVNKLPEVTVAGGFYCVDPVTLEPLNTFTLIAVTDNGADPTLYSYEWTKDGGILPDTGSTLVVDEQGSYTVTATNLATNCVSEPSDAAIVTATSAAIISDVIVTNAFTDNATITVIVDPTSLGDYEFRLDEGPWQDGNVFAPVSAGDHVVYVRDRNNGGCIDSQPIPVSVIDYPNYFTPNGDGYNDTWNIIGLASQPEASIFIFDRYGKLLKQISPAGEGWNGTMNGSPLPSTDYWFKVIYLENDVAKEFKAHFSLKR